MPEPIPHIEERKKLLALFEQREALEREEEDALAQPKAALREAEKRANEEYRAAGGLGMARALDMAALDDPRQRELQSKLMKEMYAKPEPQRVAYHAAQEPFETRRAALDDEIDAIHKAIGSEFAENRWTDEEGEGGSGPMFCAIAGVPILNSDKIAVVLAAALPAKAG